MKLKYAKDVSKASTIVVMMFLIYIIISYFILPEEIFGLIYIELVFFILSVLNFIDDIKRKKSYETFRKKGTKQQGYIFRYKDIHVRKVKTNGKTLNYMLNGKIYNINGVNRDEAYEYICKELDNYTETKEKIFSIKTFPIDIYTYKNKTFADIENVKLKDNI